MLRSVLRHRDTLIKTASRSVLHMQKAYSQMNVHLHHAISDLTGVTGMAITDAILAGERDPARLAALADRRIKASRDTLIKALQGDWRAEHLLALRHARATYAHYQQLVAECDQEIEAGIRASETTSKPPGEVADDSQDEGTGAEPEPPTKAPTKRFDLRSHLTRLFGTDLTLIPGIGESTALVLFAELGPDLSRFPTAAQFASWQSALPAHTQTLVLAFEHLQSLGTTQRPSPRDKKSRSTVNSADLDMQVVNGRLVVLLAAAGRAGEHFVKTRLRLPLPAADLRHPLGPPHGLVYTLTSCPFFRDHLSDGTGERSSTDRPNLRVRFSEPQRMTVTALKESTWKLVSNRISERIGCSGGGLRR